MKSEYEPWKDTLLDLGAPDEVDNDENYVRYKESGVSNMHTSSGPTHQKQREGKEERVGLGVEQ